MDDPSNESRHFFRNRVRHDLLPAMRRVRPSIDAELLAISRAAAHWREDVEAYVGEMLDVRLVSSEALDVGTAFLAEHSRYELAVLWPAIAARAGAILDRSGIRRLAEFTKRGGVGSRIQLSGGWEVTRARNALQLRKSRSPLELLSLDRHGAKWGEWTFRPAKEPSDDDAWSAWLPSDTPLSVRSWRDGDTMSVRAGAPARKVKRFLSRAGVTGHDRASWPVVLAGDQIVWIPGVRRSDAATERSGRPKWGLPFVCEHYRR